jgi:YaiO family outer membrane protein
MNRKRAAFAQLVVCLALAGPASAAAQSDVIGSARAAVERGQRAEALTSLEEHLGAAPRDVDARLLYGLILSWEGRYDEARRQLHAVLVQAPAYDDARVALMNVAWWSGATGEARDAADAILSRDPGNQVAKGVRERLDAANRPWWAGFSYSLDSFSDGRAVWQEYATTITRLTPRGSVSVKANEARRFGYGDRALEVEFYPRVRPGTYAFVGLGVSPGSAFYPGHRIAFDLYQSVGGGVEVSGGYRRLAFSGATSIYVGTVSKYLGSWMFTGKVFGVPGSGDSGSTSYHGGFRRYVRDDGLSYVGVTYSHGFSREEIRNVTDLETLDSDTVRIDIDQQFARRFRVFASGGTSWQQRIARQSLWQTSASGGVMVRF